MAGSQVREQVLQALDVDSVAQKLGLRVTKRSGAWLDCHCPLHDDTKPSFRLALAANGEHEKGFWICNAGCGHGSIFDLVIATGVAADFGEALAFLGGRSSAATAASSQHSSLRHREDREPLEVSSEAQAVAPLPPVVSEVEVDQAAKELQRHPDALRYLTEVRGLTSSVIKAMRIGFSSGCIALPKPLPVAQHFKMLPFPRPERKSKDLRFWHTKGADASFLYPMSDLGSVANDLVPVFESELDAALAISFDFAAVATGGTSHFTMKMLAPLIAHGYVPLLLFDQDKQGISAGRKCIAQLREHNATYAVTREALPPACKDFGDIVAECGRDEARAWLERAVKNVEVSVPRSGAREVNEKLERYIDDKNREVTKRTLANLKVVLDHDPRWSTRLWLNALGNTEMLGDKELSDEDLTEARMAIESDYEVKFGIDDVCAMASVCCRERTMNPVRAYLEGLVWDSTERLDSMCIDLLALSKQQDLNLKSAYVRKWMISAVARALAPGSKVDTILVLYSKDQGIGKSRFFAALGGDWFCDQHPDIENRDYLSTVHRSWIVELSELDATTRRRDLSELRAFISRTEDSVRAPYQRKVRTLRRHFVFAGTTNDMGVIKEGDGRRYWPVEVLEVDVPATIAQRDQLWAEAVAAYRSGEKWWLTDEDENRRRADSTAFFTEEDATVEAIASYLKSERYSQDNGIAIDEIMRYLRDSGIQAGPKLVPSVLRKLGMEKRDAWTPKGLPREQQRNVKRWFFTL